MTLLKRAFTNYWNGASNAWTGEPSSTLTVGLSYDTGVWTGMHTWAFDLAFESLSGKLMVAGGDETPSTGGDLFYTLRTAGAGGYLELETREHRHRR